MGKWVIFCRCFTLIKRQFYNTLLFAVLSFSKEFVEGSKKGGRYKPADGDPREMKKMVSLERKKDISRVSTVL